MHSLYNFNQSRCDLISCFYTSIVVAASTTTATITLLYLLLLPLQFIPIEQLTVDENKCLIGKGSKNHQAKL